MTNILEITQEEATGQVRQMGRMLASLYYHMSKEIIAELGEEKGKELILKAIKSYGEERGIQHRARILEAGIEHVPENYGSLSDLPQLGWEVEKVPGGENQTQIKINYCPYAEYWKEIGFEKYGRLYCSVDQAKYAAFHSDSDYVHLQNVLDGDYCCEMVCRSK